MLFRSERDLDAPYVEVFNELAKEYEDDDYNFFVSGIYLGIEEQLANWAGVNEEDLPTLLVLNFTDDMEKYKYQGDLETATIADLEKFVKEFKDKKLSMY